MLAAALGNLGTLYLSQGQLPSAEESLTRAVTVCRQVLRDEAESAALWQLCAACPLGLAECHRVRQRPKEAREACAEAQRFLRKAADEASANPGYVKLQVHVYTLFGNLAFESENVGQAREHYRQG